MIIMESIVLRDTEVRHIPLDQVFDTYIRYAKHAYECNPPPSLCVSLSLFLV